MLLDIIAPFVLLLFLSLLYYMNTNSFKRVQYYADYEAIQKLREIRFQYKKEIEKNHRVHLDELKQKSHTT